MTQLPCIDHSLNLVLESNFTQLNLFRNLVFHTPKNNTLIPQHVLHVFMYLYLICFHRNIAVHISLNY